MKKLFFIDGTVVPVVSKRKSRLLGENKMRDARLMGKSLVVCLWGMMVFVSGFFMSQYSAAMGNSNSVYSKESADGYSITTSTSMENALYVVAGKVKVGSSAEAYAMVHKASPVEIKYLQEMAQSVDRDFRFGSISLLMERADTRDVAYSLASKDAYFKVQVVPLVWLRTQNIPGIESEYKKQQDNVLKNYSSGAAIDALKSLSQGDWRSNVLRGSDSDFSAFYAEEYLLAVKDRAKDVVKDYLLGNPTTPAWNIFADVMVNDSQDPSGVWFMLQVLENNLATSGAISKRCESAKYYVGPALQIASVGQAHPEKITPEIKEHIKRILVRIGGVQMALPCETTHNAFHHLKRTMVGVNNGNPK